VRLESERRGMTRHAKSSCPGETLPISKRGARTHTFPQRLSAERSRGGYPVRRNLPSHRKAYGAKLWSAAACCRSVPARLLAGRSPSPAGSNRAIAREAISSSAAGLGWPQASLRSTKAAASCRTPKLRSAHRRVLSCSGMLRIEASSKCSRGQRILPISKWGERRGRGRTLPRNVSRQNRAKT